MRHPMPHQSVGDARARVALSLSLFSLLAPERIGGG
jgi:hypothetical protein